LNAASQTDSNIEAAAEGATLSSKTNNEFIFINNYTVTGSQKQTVFSPPFLTIGASPPYEYTAKMDLYVFILSAASK